MMKVLKVGINGRPLCQSEMRGLARHTIELLTKMHALHPEIEFHLYTYGKFAESHKRHLPFAHFHESSPRLKILWDLWTLPRELKRDGIKLFHSTNNVGLPLSSSIKTIVTIHDDLTHRHRMNFSPRHWWSLANYLVEYFILKRADAFITISQQAGRDVLKAMSIAPEKLTVIYNGVEMKSALSSVQEDYYLYVGGLEERKNIPRLLQAFQKLSDKKLVLVSNLKTATEEIRKLLENPGFPLEIREKITDEELARSYQNARALIYPSLYEGFGLPVVEAMRMKIPVILSDIPVLREIAGDGAVYFNPENVDELVNAIRSGESGNSVLEKNYLRSLDFTWETMAKKTYDIYLRLGLSANGDHESAEIS